MYYLQHMARYKYKTNNVDMTQYCATNIVVLGSVVKQTCRLRNFKHVNCINVGLYTAFRASYSKIMRDE